MGYAPGHTARKPFSPHFYWLLFSLSFFFKGFKRDWLIRALTIPKVKTVPMCNTIKQRARVTDIFLKKNWRQGQLYFFNFMPQGLIFILFYFYFITSYFCKMKVTLKLCPYCICMLLFKSFLFIDFIVLLVPCPRPDIQFWITNTKVNYYM